MSIEGKLQKRMEEMWSETREPEFALSKEPRAVVVIRDWFKYCREHRAAGRTAVGFVNFQLS